MAASPGPHPPDHNHSIVSTAVRKQNTSNPLGLFALLLHDLLLDILYRLHVKSLLILKCVSKPLNSFISDPKFEKDHFRLSQTRHYHLLICPWDLFSKEFLLFDSQIPFVLDNSTGTIPGTKLNYPLSPSDIHASTVESCDGIIFSKMFDRFSNHEDMVVWNPCTRKFKILPPLKNIHSLSSNTIHTMGYDQSTDSYKVVAILCNKFCKTQVRIHTLGTNFWRTIPDFPSQLMGEAKYYLGKFVSGNINWAIEDQKNYNSWVILSLDLGNESYQEILQPDYGLDEPLQNFSLGVSRDNLCVLAHTETFLDIWVMKDYRNKDSWTKLFSLPFAKFPDYYGYTNLLYISEEDDQLFLDFYSKIYVYNYKTGTVKIPAIQDLPSTSFISNVYVESLISP